MNSLLFRIRSKCSRLYFIFRNKNRFRYLGRHVYMAHPYRLDLPQSVTIGDNTVFQRGTWLYCHTDTAEIAIEKGCQFGYNNHIAAVQSVRIGRQVLTANNVYISDNAHGFADITVPIMDQAVLFKGEVEIGDGSWIGENACILGVKIGRNCVVGANSVVTHNVPDYSVVVGAPARVIKYFDLSTQCWVSVKEKSEKS